MKLFTACLLLLPNILGALDLTPRENEASSEGMKFTYLEFQDSSARVTYVPPRAWEFSGTPSLLKLFPASLTQVDADISIETLRVPLPLPGTSPKCFEQLALQALPVGASKVEMIGTVENPFEIDGRQTIEVTLKYVLFGQSQKTSCVFFSRRSELLRCRVSARAGDFEAVRRTFHHSLHTLSGL